MTTASKTIGPMTLDSDNDWMLNPLAHLCGATMRNRFNIPNSATKLWVKLTKCRPPHGDAIRVRFNCHGEARLDNDLTFDFYIVRHIREQASNFNNDFYATIYYE